MAPKPKKTTQAERERRRKELERRRNDDAVMLVSAETLLDEPSRCRTMPETYFAAMMLRLIELLKNEQAKRPAHRPAAKLSTGAEVAGLIAAGKSKKIAIQWVMRRRKLTQATVERRLREHEARRAAKSTP